jgi:serine/threonine protein kinase
LQFSSWQNSGIDRQRTGIGAACRREGRLAGEPLSRLLDERLGLLEFLRISIRLTAALGQVHERGLIHKDIKPENILVHQESGGVWLTGFGVASHLPREHHAAAPRSCTTAHRRPGSVNSCASRCRERTSRNVSDAFFRNREVLPATNG